ncbi:MAG TPA: hypothetical protein VIM16_12865 [Mucilaginibacter sp.]|jgi:hypothetical protein
MKAKLCNNPYVFSLKDLIFIACLLIFNLFFSGASAQYKPWVAPKTAEYVKNPLAGNKSTIAIAKTLYVADCSPGRCGA